MATQPPLQLTMTALKLTSDITFQSQESSPGYYIIYCPKLENQIRVNESTKKLIDLIREGNNINSIINKLKVINPHNDNITENNILSTVSYLKKVGVIEDESFSQPQKKSYIWLKTTMFPAKVVSKIASLFTIFFVPSIYYLILFICSILFTSYLIFIDRNGIFNFINVKDILLYLPLAYIGKVLHEFGHAAALKKHKIDPGPIGFGFYLFNPVFYADVSSAWVLNASKRIIINIGGMYFQLLQSFILLLLFYIVSNTWFLYASFFSFLSILPNLNPFIRYDGYWILSDILNIPNLKKKATEKLLEVKSWIFSRNMTKNPLNNATSIFLLFYSIANQLMVVAFVTYTLVYASSSVLALPANLTKFISQQINCENCSRLFELKTFLFQNFFAMIFYFILISILLSQSNRILKKIKR